MKAAVLREFKQPLAIEDVVQPEPAAHEVLIEVEACGVCHSDLHVGGRRLAANSSRHQEAFDPWA